ncbi:hypothetical protein [Legionella brunensis]|nr:hypothetical protein [Legionella brunensis]
MGKIYFRSDTRSPDEIFKIGFTPRIDYADLWWLEAIKSRGYKNDCGIANEAIDADSKACICLTTKLESAPIFPLNDEDTYIYAIILPDMTQIDYPTLKTTDYRPVLLKNDKTPTDSKDLIIDLHSFQAKQASNIYSFFAEKEVEDTAITSYAAWPLYAYEAIAYQVPPAAIVGAIKCERKPLKNKVTISCDFISETPKKSYDRDFILEGDIIVNPFFFIAHHLWLGKEGLTTLDFSVVKEEALDLLYKAANKPLETPNIYWGLGGKTL